MPMLKLKNDLPLCKNLKQKIETEIAQLEEKRASPAYALALPMRRKEISDRIMDLQIALNILNAHIQSMTGNIITPSGVN